MIIPLRTNRMPKRRPLVTELLIITNMLVYLAGLVAESSGRFDRLDVIEFGHLLGRDLHLWQFVTYQFLHDPHAIWHLAFNMLFLWVFGSAVEDRLGRLGYLGFYLLGGAVAGGGHVLVDPQVPVIGASGSIAAVTGAFLALFPRSRIRILLFFFFIGVYEIPALWFIGFYFILDVLRQTGELLGGGGARVAYVAHLAGYVYGFGLAFALLATGIVPREEFDVFHLFRQSRRRAAFRAASREPAGGLWDSASADTGRRLERKKAKAAADPDPPRSEHAEARQEIDHLLATHDLPAAATKYAELLRRDPDTVFSEHRQLDLANQLQADRNHELAARAYELLLRTYPACPKAAEVRLILGLIYARQLDRPQPARDMIERARASLTEPDQKALADQMLAELGS